MGDGTVATEVPVNDDHVSRGPILFANPQAAGTQAPTGSRSTTRSPKPRFQSHSNERPFFEFEWLCGYLTVQGDGLHFVASLSRLKLDDVTHGPFKYC